MAADAGPVMADSSVWFDWYNGKATQGTMVLEQLLVARRIWVHSDVIREFALGRKTTRLMDYIVAMRQLPRVDDLSINEFLAVVDEFDLRGSGKSRDTFLFAAAIQHGVVVLTSDRAFQRKCERVSLCYFCQEGIPHEAALP